jgi:hypothetical protein
VPGLPQTTQIPRLTNHQYENTVRDLTSLVGQHSAQLAPDGTGSVDQRTWDGYKAAAQTLAAQVMADPTARATVISCTPADDGTACANQMIQEFGPRAFRRPLTAEETTKFQALYTNRALITATGTFDEAVELIIRAFLLSPSFLTRGEIVEVPDGNRIPLGPYEVASRLSYLLWSSMPDAELFNAAVAGSLSTPEGILGQAQRMLTDPKARTSVLNFHREYAHMGAGRRWADISRDPNLYPAFNAAQVPLMTQETEAFFDYIVFDMGGTFQDLITSPVGFVNADTAPLYGLDAAQYGAGLTGVNLDAALRPGVFTRLGFLASHSLYDRPSPILRGAFLQKEVLCTTIGAPPPGAEGTALPTDGLVTNRERVDAQTAEVACAGCHHTLINPTGFALEPFDAVGSFRTVDNGVTIDSTAAVQMGDTTVNVTGPLDLMTAIANSPDAQRCYAEKWVEHAYERPMNPADACTVDTMATKLTEGGYTVVNLIADLTQSEQFRYRAIPEAP